MGLWLDLLIIQTLIGYCFVIANVSIGLYNIRDLGNMKGDIDLVRWHKRIGWIETVFFYALMTQCIIMVIQAGITQPFFYDITGPVGLHSMIGGILATTLFSIKFYLAHFKKDLIYKIGQYIGPLGFIGWSLGHWTSLYDYYYNPYVGGSVIPFLPQNIVIAGILPIPVGISIFLYVLLKRGGTRKQKRFSVHQLAFILHGITFGYEKATRELLGTPALFKYVVPKTYEFLDKMMKFMGIDLKKLEQMNVNDALNLFMEKAEKIKMAEKIKVKWDSDKTLSVESINCSTASVRSVMSKEELSNAICPWAIIAATIVNKITKKDLEMDPSDFNEIGAITKLKIID